MKPWAFTETPRGWSSVLDGIRGDGYDVVRVAYSAYVAAEDLRAVPVAARTHTPVSAVASSSASG